MADVLKMAKQLISITEQMRNRFCIYYTNGEMYDFDQTWASTAMGFGGCGGSAMTTERTYVFIPKESEVAYVFFGDGFAYMAHRNEKFWEDVRNHNMASVSGSVRYEI
jgi:hypothetical protein